MLNDEERAKAAAYGWIVCEIYDMQTARVRVGVLPTPDNKIKNATDLLKVVIHRAKNRDAFAHRVLKLVMDSIKNAAEPQPQKRKRKK